MGRLVYDNMRTPIEIEDRALAHLRVVLMNKLRRGEPFMLSLPSEHGSGRRDLWMHPTIQCHFEFHGSREPQLNRVWVEALMESANSSDGMRLVPEPRT